MSHFVTVRTYSEMRRVMHAFAALDSLISFLVVSGDPGIGKTNTFRRQVKDATILECNTTPFGLYTALYAYRLAKVIVLDDVDTLTRSPVGINLLKSVCQTDPIKTVSWNTMAADREGLPRSFTIQARVLLFCNVLPGKGGNFEAVMDRAIAYHFQPTAREVHNEVQGWMDRGETETPLSPVVFDFIGRHLDRIRKPTFRDYIKASQLEVAGLDWRTALRARWDEDPKLAAAAEIVQLGLAQDPNYDTADKRARAFADWGLGCRSTYMVYQRQVLQSQGLDRIG